MSYIQNAIHAIENGIEDYQKGTESRKKAAVRNLYSGILLLFKEKLYRLSPAPEKNLLLKENIIPYHDGGDELKFKSFGRQNITYETLNARFKSLNINVDWKRLEEIKKLRNDIEHAYTTSALVREVVAKSFKLISDFITIHLDEQPSKIIKIELWQEFLTLNEVYEAESIRCTESWEKIEWKYQTPKDALPWLRCNKCQSELVKAIFDNGYPNVSMICASCGFECNFEDIASDLMGNFFGNEIYYALREGEGQPCEDCPECGRFTYVIEEGCCIICDYELEHERCERCDVKLSVGEQWLSGLCEYCDYMMSKD